MIRKYNRYDIFQKIWIFYNPVFLIGKIILTKCSYGEDVKKVFNNFIFFNFSGHTYINYIFASVS